MNSTDLKELDNPALSLDQRALLQCRIVSELIHTGQYNEARKVLGDLWQGIGEHPNLTGLKTLTAAEVLLQCGVLSRWLGSIRQLPVQEKAKDLIFEAYRKFKSQSQHFKVSEAQYELGMCYFRLGAYDESRVILNEAQTLAETIGETDLKARILIRKTLVEIWTGCYHEAWDILREAREFFETCNDVFKGKWHGQMGLVLRRLAAIESNVHYYDRAIIEYTAAIYHYEQAHHEQYCAVNLNNLAFLLYKLKRFKEAHENLDRALKILIRLKDDGLLAQVNETRARILVAEKRHKEADRIIGEAIKILEHGGQTALLADSLTTRGVIWSRLGEHNKSIGILRDAMNLAMDAGSSCNAANAALCLIEEHIERLSNIELYEIFHRANELLKSTQDAEDLKRLRQVSSAIMKRLLGPQLGDKDFNLTKVVHKYEAGFIEEALERASGIVTRAAKLLGFKHHGSLTSLLKRRHKNLAPKRTPPQKRRKYSLGSRSKALCEVKKSKTITILYVEDNSLVSSAVKETLECEGWSVDIYADGLSALERIESHIPYDIFLLDYDLPDITGIEIIHKIKKLPHRKHIPIVMFTASGFREEAQQAGADVFLKKPEDIYSLVESVNQLLQDA